MRVLSAIVVFGAFLFACSPALSAQTWKPGDGKPLWTGPMPSPSESVLPEGPYPGMSKWNVGLAMRLVWDSQWIVQTLAGGNRVSLWVKSVGAYLKPNGWYGLMVNGNALDESVSYIRYGVKLVNLQTLFSFGSRQSDDSIPPALDDVFQ